MNAQAESRMPEDGRTDVLSIFLMIWEYRKIISLVTFLATVAGVVYALVASPVYYSEVTAAPRESDDGRSATASLISQLGGVGGLVASRMGGGGANLDRIEIILKGNELAEIVIRKHDLLPVIFQDEWDAVAKTWKGGPGAVPSLRLGAKELRESWLSVSVNSKKGMFSIGVQANDSVLAKKVVEYYLEALSERIRTDVMRNAEADRQYLEQQLTIVSDPMLRERLHTLIGSQIEKTMLVRTRVFDVLEKPLVPIERKSPKRKRIVMLSFFFGFFASVVGIFARKSLKVLKVALAERGYRS